MEERLVWRVSRRVARKGSTEGGWVRNFRDAGTGVGIVYCAISEVGGIVLGEAGDMGFVVSICVGMVVQSCADFHFMSNDMCRLEIEDNSVQR